MSNNLSGLARRVNTLHKGLIPVPRVTNCTGAREALLAKLSAHMTEEQRNTPKQELSEEKQEQFQTFRAMLAEMVKESEQKHNVRYVSYG